MYISISSYTYTYRYIHIHINIYIHTSSTATTTMTHPHIHRGGGGTRNQRKSAASETSRAPPQPHNHRGGGGTMTHPQGGGGVGDAAPYICPIHIYIYIYKRSKLFFFDTSHISLNFFSRCLLVHFKNRGASRIEGSLATHHGDLESSLWTSTTSSRGRETPKSTRAPVARRQCQVLLWCFCLYQDEL